ncbi:MAG: hypothetical protein U5K30_05370 [Acidimicrobiales bacterium]|nr:hypothetical protein [Acidimicrobiales bacterium]
MTEQLDTILDDDYLGDVTSLAMDDVRERRNECRDLETGVSYLRRMVQGRLDVVAAERVRRAEGGDGEELEDLIARLPEVLAGNTRSAGMGRLPSSLGTGALDDGLVAELEGIVSSSHITEPHSLSDDDLAAVHDQLAEFETKVSGLRRQLFERIDAFEAELTRRYRTGEASVDSLLS